MMFWLMFGPLLVVWWGVIFRGWGDNLQDWLIDGATRTERRRERMWADVSQETDA